MRSVVKKWSEAALAALCVLAIVFAALYTRQDDLRRLAARSAAESLDQRLEDARTPAPWRMPVPQPPETAYAGAERSAGGLWRFSPWIAASRPGTGDCRGCSCIRASALPPGRRLAPRTGAWKCARCAGKPISIPKVLFRNMNGMLLFKASRHGFMASMRFLCEDPVKF